MKKLFAVATSLALALVIVLPGVVTAVPYMYGTLDQQADSSDSNYYGLDGDTLVQTITPSKTGSISRLEVYCGWDGDGEISLTVAGVSKDFTCYSPGGWYTVVYTSTMPAVVAGQPFSMTVASPRDHYGILGLAAANYTGGTLTANGDPLDDYYDVKDLAFRIYTIESPATTYAWSLGSVPAGVSTPVTLNATINYPELGHEAMFSVANPAAISLEYVAKFDALPSWFTPTGVTCSAQIVPSECQVAKLATGMAVTTSFDPMTVTVAIAGIAAPPTGASGSGSAGGTGCIVIASANICGNAQALLGVGSAAATLPISSTSSDSAPASSSGMPVALLLVGGFASVMAALAAVMVRRNRS
jgi:hypothetical protein